MGEKHHKTRSNPLLPTLPNNLLKENKKLAKELKSATKSGSSDSVAEAKKLLDKCEKIGDSSIIIGRLSPTTVEQARSAIDMLRKKAKSAVIVLGFAEGDRATLLAAVTDNADTAQFVINVLTDIGHFFHEENLMPFRQ